MNVMNSSLSCSILLKIWKLKGHHGDAGAAIADCVLPGAAYTEKQVVLSTFSFKEAIKKSHFQGLAINSTVRTK